MAESLTSTIVDIDESIGCPWQVYILRCRDHSLYTGITNQMERRLRQHQNGTGAQYTRSRLPVELVYQERVISRSAALRREYAIKQLSRTAKLELINHQ